ncbi:diadenylate cyclase CdaA [Flavobacteriales bacterium]|nr:diadenylate cyclase CdaA [Flavobacteriales bacterium]
MSPLSQIDLIDLIDVLLVAFLIYQLYQIIKGTVAIRIFVGIFFIYLFWKITEVLKMELLSEILGQFIGVGVIALIIVFQQELRRFLLLIGTSGFFRDNRAAKRLFSWTKGNQNEVLLDIPAIVLACTHMAESKTGALIVIARSTDLGMITSTGDEINGKVSNRLIENIFFKNSPLHDGAMVIDKNIIKAARCVLPSTENKNFPATLGMRHRAAVGITESTDAITISVSEQTGDISLSKEGKLERRMTPDDLRDRLLKELN